MNDYSIVCSDWLARERKKKRKLHKENYQWKVAALGLLILSISFILSQHAAVLRANQAAAAWEQQYYTAVSLENEAAQACNELLERVEEDQAERAALEAAYGSLTGYRYIGECTVTAYCPCEECCGRWADGITSTGLPAVPGIVAVDPEVIPLGSTVIIDGQKYLAADTGVTGYCVDIFLEDHAGTVRHGVQSAEVWVVDVKK